MTVRIPAAWFLLGFLFAPAFGATVRLTPDLGPILIQDTMDSAVYGDTVLVAPGQYKTLTVRNGITLMSEEGPDVTVFRYDHEVVNANEVDSTTVIQGITVDGVRASEGVIVAENSKVRIRDCILKNGWVGVRSIYSDIVIENCVIHDCQNGIYLFESQGSISSNEIRKCLIGISLVNAAPRILRNTITGNSLGISVAEHSDPSIGGSLATANRVFGNPGGAVKNTALIKRSGVRTLKPYTISVPYNFWGTDCPDSTMFRGPVLFRPWVTEDGKRSLDTCEAASSE